MFNEINELKLFFEDCYRQVSVREYARLMKVAPATASTLLKEYSKSGYLKKKEERRHLLFSLNNGNKKAIDLSRLYWKEKLKDLVDSISKNTVNSSIVLFGSLSKAEATPESDIDLAVFAPEKKNIDLSKMEKKLGRKISVYWFKSSSDVKNEHLLNNILNGVILSGRIKWR